MKENVIARRYAGALFSLDKKAGTQALDAHGECLGELSRLLREEPRFQLILKSPVISAEEKKNLLHTLLKKMVADQTMFNFCSLLADKERLGALQDIAEWYRFLLDDAHGIVRGKVITAIKLTPNKQAEMKDALEKKFGKNMELTFHVDPDILGGMILMVGSRVMDASLRAQLGLLRETLRRGR